MIQQFPLKQIHWDYIKPKGKLISASQSLILLPIKSGHSIDESKRAIKFRLTYRMKNGENDLLSYIAEKQFMMEREDADIITDEEIKRMVLVAYSNFQYKFDQNKVGTILYLNTLHDFDTTKIDYELIRSLLK